jgi:hypothetical protein
MDRDVAELRVSSGTSTSGVGPGGGAFVSTELTAPRLVGIAGPAHYFPRDVLFAFLTLTLTIGARSMPWLDFGAGFISFLSVVTVLLLDRR